MLIYIAPLWFVLAGKAMKSRGLRAFAGIPHSPLAWTVGYKLLVPLGESSYSLGCSPGYLFSSFEIVYSSWNGDSIITTSSGWFQPIFSIPTVGWFLLVLELFLETQLWVHSVNPSNNVLRPDFLYCNLFLNKIPIVAFNIPTELWRIVFWVWETCILK